MRVLFLAGIRCLPIIGFLLSVLSIGACASDPSENMDDDTDSGTTSGEDTEDSNDTGDTEPEEWVDTDTFQGTEAAFAVVELFTSEG